MCNPQTNKLNHNELRVHGHDRAESFHWTLAPETNKDLVPLQPGETYIQLSIYFQEKRAWLHRNLYHNSIKGIVILLKIFLFVQLFIPAALHMGNLDRAEILRWTLAAQTNKDN